MDDFIVVAGVMKLFYAVLALTMVTLWLRYLDLRAGVDFKEFFKDLRNDPKAAAQYLGHRWLGACIVVGWLLS